MKKRIDVLVFGGSFDPIHEGHVHMLRCAISECRPEHVIIVPNYISPLKSETLFSNVQRYKMTQVAIESEFPEANISVSNIEVVSASKSYTVNTLETISAEFPNKKLGFLCGSDTALTFHKWAQPEKVLRLATCVVVLRNAHSKVDVETYFEAQFKTENYWVLGAFRHSASSTLIRSEMTVKKDVLNHVPKGIKSLVKEYLNDNRSNR